MINYESELIENQRKILTDNFNANIEEIKSNIDPNMLSNNELTLDLARKMIANLVVENADMQRKIIKAMEHLKIKQARLINEEDYVITDLDLDEIMKILDIRNNKNEEIK